ncbi:MAG: DNA recombination protein RmuC [Butyrivibrio sp.]|nr:DNA recombination protein RmuC [Butyrivibrio sp.]
MDTIILICCAVIIALLIAVLIKLFVSSDGKALNEIRNLLEQSGRTRREDNRDVAEQISRMSEAALNQTDRIGRDMREAQERQQKALSESLAKIEGEMRELRRENGESLERINRAVTENYEKLRRENRESLDKINDAVNEKLQKTLDDRISKSFETVNLRLKEVYEGLGEMKNVASGVTDLKNVLSNVKTRGILGEIQLGAILEEILAHEQYGEQVQTEPGGSERVDFAVKLPGPNDEGIWLPIDSKFPGDTYASLQRAYETGNLEAVKAAQKALSDEIKRCAKSIGEKYIKVPYTTNFAIMFLPFEGLYAEVVNMGLIELLQRDYKINIAGPSTMAAMLNSLRMGFATLAIQKKSGQVWEILKAAKAEFGKFEAGLKSIQKRLRGADSDLEELIGTRTNAINRKLSSVENIEGDEASEKILGI